MNKKFTVTFDSTKDYATLVLMASAGAAALDATGFDRDTFDVMTDVYASCLDADGEDESDESEDDYLEGLNNLAKAFMEEGDIENMVKAEIAICKMKANLPS